MFSKKAKDFDKALHCMHLPFTDAKGWSSQWHQVVLQYCSQAPTPKIIGMDHFEEHTHNSMFSELLLALNF